MTEVKQTVDLADTWPDSTITVVLHAKRPRLFWARIIVGGWFLRTAAALLPGTITIEVDEEEAIA